MDIKGEIVRRTGLDPAIVDQVLNALGQLVNERYPQFAGLLGPALGINVGGTGTAGTGTTGAAGTGAGAQGMPDLGQLGGLFGGAGDTGTAGGTGTTGTGTSQGETKS